MHCIPYPPFIVTVTQFDGCEETLYESLLLQLLVAAAIAAHQIHAIWCHDVGPGVHFISLGLLQLTFYGTWTDDPAAVCPECAACLVLGTQRCDHMNGSATPAALVSTSEAGRLQDSHLCLPFVVQHSSSLPGRWLSAVIWRRSSSAAFCRLEDLYRQADLWQLWGLMFYSCQVPALSPRLWNSFPADVRQTDISDEQFKRLLKTSLFGHSDCGALCLIVYILRLPKFFYLLTSLLTMSAFHSIYVTDGHSTSVCGLCFWALFCKHSSCAVCIILFIYAV